MYGSSNKNGGLCGVPFSILRKQAIDVQVNMHADAEISNETEGIVTITHSNTGATNAKQSCQDANNNSLLWVEKFRPKNFLELLSDDGTNRTLLRWLKLWDKVVFNRDVKRKQTQNDMIESQKSNDQNIKILPTEVRKNSIRI